MKKYYGLKYDIKDFNSLLYCQKIFLTLCSKAEYSFVNVGNNWLFIDIDVYSDK